MTKKIAGIAASLFLGASTALATPAHQYTSVHEFTLMDTQEQTDTVNNILNVIYNYHAQNGLDQANACMIDLFMNTPLESPDNGYQMVYSHFTTAAVLPLDEQPRIEDLVTNIVGQNCLEQDTARTLAQPAPAPAG